MAEVLKVSESGYYNWLARRTAPPTQREREELVLVQEIFDIFSKSRGSFGSRKITYEINKNRVQKVNHKRIARIMSEYCWYSKPYARYVRTTDSNHDEAIADNLIDRNFTATMPNEKMLSDTTVVQTKQGDVYAAAILDLYGRMPVGLAMSLKNDKALVMSAFKDMLMRGLGAPGCILHSDRGSTYCSKDYRILLSKYDFICSMSQKGDCWDNAPMESFWGKMKAEWLKDKYDTIEEAKRDIFEYVWSFYPRKRPHASNGYLTPLEYYERV